MSHLRLPVEEFTTPNPITADADATVEQMKKLMDDHGIRHLPIKKGHQIVGIVSDRDLRVVSCLDLREKKLVRASDIMAPDPVSVDSEATLDEVAFEMSKLKIGSVIVTENDKFLGIFTVTDALNALIEVSRSVQEQ